MLALVVSFVSSCLGLEQGMVADRSPASPWATRARTPGQASPRRAHATRPLRGRAAGVPPRRRPKASRAAPKPTPRPRHVWLEARPGRSRLEAPGRGARSGRRRM